MHQIRFHGRGGQGVVTAAELAAIAAFGDGHYSQAFPSFGVERTGAPIEAFARIDDAPIRTREHIYEPDVIIVQDPSLIGAVDVTKGADRETLVIVNTAKAKADIQIPVPADNLFVLDATKIALEVIGKNIVNTVILGAFAKATGLITLKSLETAVREKFASKPELAEKNVKAVRRAYGVGGEA